MVSLSSLKYLSISQGWQFSALIRVSPNPFPVGCLLPGSSGKEVTSSGMSSGTSCSWCLFPSRLSSSFPQGWFPVLIYFFCPLFSSFLQQLIDRAGAQACPAVSCSQNQCLAGAVEGWCHPCLFHLWCHVALSWVPALGCPSWVLQVSSFQTKAEMGEEWRACTLTPFLPMINHNFLSRILC